MPASQLELDKAGMILACEKELEMARMQEHMELATVKTKIEELVATLAAVEPKVMYLGKCNNLNESINNASDIKIQECISVLAEREGNNPDLMEEREKTEESTAKLATAEAMLAIAEL